MKINRWIKYRPGCIIELHGFSDASMLAYGCCIYVKIYNDDEIYTTLLTAKTKVAPLKATTLPKLELCGAHLLALLMKKVKSALKIKISAIKCYSDSEITLAWIKAPANKWKIFVAKRVKTIQSIVE